MYPGKAKTEKGFTLIELLVVISIIALLLSILMPSLGKVKDMARGTTCAAQLKQFGLAWYFYAEDNDGKNIWYAPFTEWLNGKFWHFQLAPYFGDDRFESPMQVTDPKALKIMRCPATRPYADKYGDAFGYGAADQCWQFVADHEGAYTLNGWMQENSGSTDNRFIHKYDQAKPDTPLITDGGWVDAWPTPSEAAQSANLINLDGAGYPNSTYRMGTALPRLVLARHGRAINVLFKGSQVEKIPLEKLWTLSWYKGWERVDELELPVR